MKAEFKTGHKIIKEISWHINLVCKKMNVESIHLSKSDIRRISGSKLDNASVNEIIRILKGKPVLNAQGNLKNVRYKQYFFDPEKMEIRWQNKIGRAFRFSPTSV